MLGSVAAPKEEARRFSIPVAAATRLAFYSVADGPGVLAPRGWHCHHIFGSDGSFLIVSPEPVSVETLYAMRRPHGCIGSVVVLSFVNGFTSGRDEVSPIVIRIFPRHHRYVVDQAKNMEQPVPARRHPFRGDKLRYLSAESVEYTTRAHREGLGTTGFLRPPGLPIHGVETLTEEGGDCCDLTSLAVRLGPADADLATVIRQQIESNATAR